MHETLGTTRHEIEAIIKDYADPVRHGHWSAFKPTTAADRNKMLQLTREILARYLKWSEGLPNIGVQPSPAKRAWLTPRVRRTRRRLREWLHRPSVSAKGRRANALSRHGVWNLAGTNFRRAAAARAGRRLGRNSS
jgi:hypothetical protein